GLPDVRAADRRRPRARAGQDADAPGLGRRRAAGAHHQLRLRHDRARHPQLLRHRRVRPNGVPVSRKGGVAMTAKKKRGPKIEPKACERVMLGLGHARRFTQDSPILPDVWMKFAEDLDEPRELLLTPYGDSRPGDVRSLIAERLKKDRKTSGKA